MRAVYLKRLIPEPQTTPLRVVSNQRLTGWWGKGFFERRLILRLVSFERRDDRFRQNVMNLKLVGTFLRQFPKAGDRSIMARNRFAPHERAVRQLLEDVIGSFHFGGNPTIRPIRWNASTELGLRSRI